MSLHTHYDDLNVTRNAPQDVIRAAYRVLAQRYHPDVNPTPDAERIMKAINEAYAVLSDTRRRAAHDAWIEDQIVKSVIDDAVEEVGREAGKQPSPTRPNALARMNNWMGTPKGNKFGFFVLLGGALIALLLTIDLPFKAYSPDTPVHDSAPLAGPSAQTPAEPEQPRGVKSDTPVRPTKGYTEFLGELDGERATSPEYPDTDAKLAVPNPEADWWKDDQRVEGPQATRTPDPDQQPVTGYVPNQPSLAQGGLSEFTVDNSSGGGDAIAKLYRGGARPAVRTFFVKQRESFTASNLVPGTYVLRYRYMGSETTYEADRKFPLIEEATEEGTRYSKASVTLYAVSNGNLKNKVVPSDEF